MRHDVLRLQSRVTGLAVVLVGLWLAFLLLGLVRERQTGTPYYTLTTDVLGVQTGSLVTLNGFEIGQVTGVALHPASTDEHSTQARLNAAHPLFRIDFQVVAPLSFARDLTRLDMEEVNPVAPARLVIRQASLTKTALMHPCPSEASQPAASPELAAGDCIPTLAMEPDARPGLGGLVAEGTETLRALRTTALPRLTDTLEQYRQAGIALGSTIDAFGQLGEDVQETNARVMDMLADRPGSLYRLPQALEETANRVAEVSEQLHGDVVERVDRMVAPETIAALARAVAELEDLIAISSHGSQETLENLAAITRTLNQIAWELERDPIGFLRGSGGGTR